MKKKFLATLLILALSTLPSSHVFAATNSGVDQVIEENGFYYDDNSGTPRLNADCDDPEFGDERECLWLTDPETGERIEGDLEVGQTYRVHVRVVNDGSKQEDLENVRVLIDWSCSASDEIRLVATIHYGNGGLIRFMNNYHCPNQGDAEQLADRELDFVRDGKAKLYNSSERLNGAQVNHRELLGNEFMRAALRRGEIDVCTGILVGYDDQDGILPYGKEYACEIRVNLRLEEEWIPRTETVFGGDAPSDVIVIPPSEKKDLTGNVPRNPAPQPVQKDPIDPYYGNKNNVGEDNVGTVLPPE